MAFFKISVSKGGQTAELYGSNKLDLSLASTHRFAGSLMPDLRAARTRGELSRLEYKRAKSLIEQRMLQNINHDASQSWPYTAPTMREVRAEIAKLA